MVAPANVVQQSRRGVLETHPWISYRLDLNKVDHLFWMLLGESRSKNRHLVNTPMKPGFSQMLAQVHVAKGVHATTAIEGNTLSEDQARAVIAGELKLPTSQEYLQREMENIIDGLNYLADRLRASGGDFDITVDLLCDLNRRVLDGVPDEDWIVPGEIRPKVVGVHRYLAPEPGDVGFLLDQMCDWLNGPDFEPVAGNPRATYTRAILKAIVAHVYIAWIHPFGNGNGRTARLVEFGILTAAGLPDVAAHLLSNHYNATRNEYYRELDYASTSGGDLSRFLLYAIQGFTDQLQLTIDMVHDANQNVAWQNFVHECFEGHGKTQKRQRDLVIELSNFGDPVKRSDIRKLSPSIAEAYAGSHPKMLSRDLNTLEKLELIVRDKGTIRARTELMYRFMPTTVNDGALD